MSKFSANQLAILFSAVAGIMILILISAGFAYGFIANHYKIFPYDLLMDSREFLNTIACENDIQQCKFVNPRPPQSGVVENSTGTKAYPGLNLVTAIGPNLDILAKVVDMQGQELHRWQVNWSDVWPEPTHLAEKEIPKTLPGTHIHGAVVLPDGDLVYNYDDMGMVRMDFCGNVHWRLPYKTHHSIHLDEDGSLWVSGLKRHEQALEEFPNYVPPFTEPTLLKVSENGEILLEISVLKLLRDNGLLGLELNKVALDNTVSGVTGDTLHLNDLESFPASMEAGLFAPGDLMISLRNINTVLVFSQADQKIKFLRVGQFHRQHDPDFIDGNTISVFDNNPSRMPAAKSSRILLLDARSNEVSEYFAGDEQTPFYTYVMGKHQWLPNGNLLMTETTGGRAIEINSVGDIVWDFHNPIDENLIGYLEEVQRLPAEFEKIFSPGRLEQCSNATQ